MGFLDSFFRETGRNTGKWASNKVFGDGWSTPHRIKHGRDDSGNGIGRASADSGEYDETDEMMRDHLREQRNLKGVLADTDFNSGNADQISTQLDDLLTAASQAISSSMSVAPFMTKIRSGILRLHRMNEPELAMHYDRELSRVRRKSLMRNIGIFFFAVFLFGMLMLIASGKFL
jgi:hypothetical protein